MSVQYTSFTAGGLASAQPAPMPLKPQQQQQQAQICVAQTPQGIVHHSLPSAAAAVAAAAAAAAAHQQQIIHKGSGVTFGPQGNIRPVSSLIQSLSRVHNLRSTYLQKNFLGARSLY